MRKWNQRGFLFLEKYLVLSLLLFNVSASIGTATLHIADWWNRCAPVVCFEAPSVRFPVWCIAANLHQAAASAEPFFCLNIFQICSPRGSSPLHQCRWAFFSSRWSLSHQLNAGQRNVFYLKQMQKCGPSEQRHIQKINRWNNDWQTPLS